MFNRFFLLQEYDLASTIMASVEKEVRNYIVKNKLRYSSILECGCCTCELEDNFRLTRVLGDCIKELGSVEFYKLYKAASTSTKNLFLDRIAAVYLNEIDSEGWGKINDSIYREKFRHHSLTWYEYYVRLPEIPFHNKENMLALLKPVFASFMLSELYSRSVPLFLYNLPRELFQEICTYLILDPVIYQMEKIRLKTQSHVEIEASAAIKMAC